MCQALYWAWSFKKLLVLWEICIPKQIITIRNYVEYRLFFIRIVSSLNEDFPLAKYLDIEAIYTQW